jgi:hypothetical protein
LTAEAALAPTATYLGSEDPGLQAAVLAGVERARDRIARAERAAELRRPRLRPRIGHGGALGAYWHMFTTGETYCELGGNYDTRRDPDRATNDSSPDSKNSVTP